MTAVERVGVAVTVLGCGMPLPTENCTALIRMTVNGEKQEDVPMRPVQGVKGAFVMKTRVRMNSLLTCQLGYMNPEDSSITMDRVVSSGLAFPGCVFVLLWNNEDKLTLKHLGSPTRIMFLSRGELYHDEAIRIIGNSPELGCWNPQSEAIHSQIVYAVRSAQLSDNVFITTVDMKSDVTEFEFKLFNFTMHGPEWEEAPFVNKKINLLARKQDLIVASTWNHQDTHKTEITIQELTKVQSEKQAIRCASASNTLAQLPPSEGSPLTCTRSEPMTMGGNRVVQQTIEGDHCRPSKINLRALFEAKFGSWPAPRPSLLRRAYSFCQDTTRSLRRQVSALIQHTNSC